MLDKMKYALLDIQITHALLQIKNSSFFKRSISRLIAIRVPDLIRYAREVNNDLSGGRSSKERRTMKDNLNALDALYQEYMADLRNKFGGHLKDIDFFERIQLWGQINEDDMLFFVSHVEEFANELAVGTGVSTVTVVDMADADAIRRISSDYDLEGKPTIATDALALSRYNTVSAIQIHELPAKASLLSSLRIILNYELSILKEIRQPEVVRAIKCLLLVDVINFFDNLFTRPVNPSAKQAMDGLDVIVERHGLTTAVDIFKIAKTETKITERAEALRATRNIVAAHLDHTLQMSVLMAQLDGLKLDEIEQVYNLMNQLFETLCRSNRTLSTALLDPTPMVGVIAVSQQPQSGFSNGTPPPTTFPAPSYSTLEMEQMWDELTRNPRDQKALMYFRYAMMNSPVEERWSETIQIGENATRTETHEIRLVHKFLQQKLQVSRGDDEKTSQVISVVIQLNSPKAILHMLEEEYDSVAEMKIADQFIFAFGELARVRDRRSVEVIMKQLEVLDLNSIYLSLTALLKIDVRDNGIRHINRQVPSMGPDSSDGKLDEIILGHLANLPPFYQTVLALTMLSELWFNPLLTTFVDYSKNVYFPRLESMLRSSVTELLAETKALNETTNILEGIPNHAYSWMAIQLGDVLKEVAQQQSRVFYKCVAHEMVRIDWRQDQLVKIHAIGLAKTGEFENAVATALHLCNMKPHLKCNCLFALQLAAEGKLLIQFETICSKLERDFILNTQDIADIQRMKTWL